MSRRGENIYKRKDDRWEGRVLKPDGKYLYVYGKSYREVREKKKYASNNQTEEQKMTIDNMSAIALFENWLSSQASGRIRRSTYDSYYSCIHKYVLPFFQVGEDRLSERRVKEFVQTINLHQHLSASYRRKIITIFKTGVRTIMKDTGLPARIVSSLQMPRSVSSPIEVFTSKEQMQIEQVILTANDFRAYGILLCFYTGIRLGELCALRWESIDLDSGIMSIRATTSRVNNYDSQESKTMMVTGNPKSSNSDRKIPIPAFMIDLFRKNLPDDERKTKYVFSSTDKPVDPRMMQRLYKRILKQAEVNDRKFHTIRHTFATRALELGIDIKTLSEILGHSSVVITLNIYAHSILEHKIIAIEKMNSMYLSHTDNELYAVKEAVN